MLVLELRIGNECDVDAFSGMTRNCRGCLCRLSSCVCWICIFRRAYSSGTYELKSCK